MKRLVLFILAVLFILPVIAHTQAPDTLWIKTYGLPDRRNECWDAINMPDGGAVLVGTSTQPAILSWLYVIRIDSNGDTLWTRTYEDGTAGRAISRAPDNGFVISGYYVSSDAYPYILKIDPTGNMIWTRVFTHWAEGGFRSCQPVGNDGYILSGYAYGGDLLLVRVDNNGDTLWSRIYGGTDEDRGWSARPTSDGGFIVAGWTESFGNGYSDFFIIKTDQNGDSLWTRTFGGWSKEEAREIMETPDGGYVFSGRSSLENPFIYYFMKLSMEGDSLWAFVDTTSYYPGMLHSFTHAADGDFALIGYTIGYAEVFKVSSDGGLVWSKSFANYPVITRWARAIIQSQDGSYFLCGNNTYDVWVVKLAAEVVGINDDIIPTPNKITLHQNYPNPFNANTSISFTLAESQNINLSIYDLLGRKVEVLLDGFTEAGTHQVYFRAGAYPSGLYFCRLEADNYSDSRMMVLLK